MIKWPPARTRIPCRLRVQVRAQRRLCPRRFILALSSLCAFSCSRRNLSVPPNCFSSTHCVLIVNQRLGRRRLPRFCRSRISACRAYRERRERANLPSRRFVPSSPPNHTQHLIFIRTLDFVDAALLSFHLLIRRNRTFVLVLLNSFSVFARVVAFPL